MRARSFTAAGVGPPMHTGVADVADCVRNRCGRRRGCLAAPAFVLAYCAGPLGPCLEAITGLIAIVVLLIVLSWFVHKGYWS